MSLTIRELAEIPSLRTSIVAGASGADNLVMWAHTCELPTPWEWLGPGDLLLTDGYSFPSEPEAQAAFIKQLSEARLAGIALGEGLHAPPLTDAAKKAADALNLPILIAAYEVPFVTFARTVADSNDKDTHGRLVRILRIYDVLRRFNEAGSSRDDLLPELGRACGVTLHVVSTRTAQPLLPSASEMGPSLHAAVMSAVRDRTGALPSFLRVSSADGDALALPLDDGSQGALVAVADDSEPDVVILQHAATVTAVEVQRRAVLRARRRDQGARLLTQLVEGTIDADVASERLTSLRLGGRPWRVLSVVGTPSAVDALDEYLAGARVAHLVAEYGSGQVILVEDTAAQEQAQTWSESTGVRIGLSRAVQHLKQVGDAAREARWALDSTRAASQSVVSYDDATPLFLPRTVSEGEALVDALLGPIIEYDTANDTDLVSSLEAYFDADRSWQRGASRLGIHKQTLLYRMRRVQELTGRRLSSMDDQTELYLAVRTRRMLLGG